MTEQVKFPGTDREAPDKIEVHPDGWINPRFAWSTRSRLYLRADTVTPNDQVIEMMRQAFVMGRQDRMESPYSNESIQVAIDEIRSRYASSDSD